jgi:hypothetical protein
MIVGARSGPGLPDGTPGKPWNNIRLCQARSNNCIITIYAV